MRSHSSLLVALLFLLALGVAAGTGGTRWDAPERPGVAASVDAPAAGEQTGEETFDRADSLAPGPDASGGETDPELLSDEERVERMLRHNGGRMKQADIVTETNWSNAKVSQLLSSMADEGRVDKLRIGRENLITLPDEEIGDFDEE